VDFGTCGVTRVLYPPKFHFFLRTSHEVLFFLANYHRNCPLFIILFIILRRSQRRGLQRGSSSSSGKDPSLGGTTPPFYSLGRFQRRHLQRKSVSCSVNLAFSWVRRLPGRNDRHFQIQRLTFFSPTRSVSYAASVGAAAA